MNKRIPTIKHNLINNVKATSVFFFKTLKNTVAVQSKIQNKKTKFRNGGANEAERTEMREAGTHLQRFIYQVS